MIRNFKQYWPISSKRKLVVLLLGMLLAPMVLLAWHTTYTYLEQAVIELLTSTSMSQTTEPTSGNATGLLVHQKL